MRQTRQPESYLDLHVARKPLARSRSHQATEEAVGARQDEACAPAELVTMGSQAAAEVQIKYWMDPAILFPAMVHNNVSVLQRFLHTVSGAVQLLFQLCTHMVSCNV